ncbi:MAG: hypothetical protein K6U00_06855 [Armatimonadetes bacterium]|nr:hypothetical protein [Armatimonadota bacterium]
MRAEIGPDFQDLYLTHMRGQRINDCTALEEGTQPLLCAAFALLTPA